MRIIEELKRRNVFRVAGVYAVVAWLLIQVVVAVLPTLGAPPWIAKVFIVLVLAGFPIALVLAWAFEMTPEGVKLTANVAEGESIAPRTGRKLDYAILGGVALIAAMFVYDRMTPEPASFETAASRPSQDEGSRANAPHPEELSASAESVSKDVKDAPDASIAVLPFVDMSAAHDQEYFGDGVAEEILNVLAKSVELKVAGRTSSFQFKGKAEDLRAIGEALGVANVLEGSIRKQGERVRITAQLIRASDGFHLWSESYDRNLTDIFSVQEEIANSIADAMQKPLGLRHGALEGARTQDPEAYDLFLKGNADFAKRGERLFEAMRNFERAVSLDPDFAAAWANLAVVYSTLPGWFDQHEGRPLRRRALWARAEYAAARAIALNPDLAASQHALGITLRDRWQWARSEDAFVKALEAEPNAAPILEDYSELLGMLGRWDAAAIVARRLVEIDPLTVQYQIRLMWAERDAGHYDAALAALKEQLRLSPETYCYWILDGLNLVVSVHGLDAAGAAFETCKNYPERSPGVARRLIDAARAHDKSAFSAAELSGLGGSEYLIYLIGGESAVLDSIEDTTFNEYFVPVAYGDKAFSAVRATPRYKQLVKDTGLDDYWRERGWPSFCNPVGDNDFECATKPVKP